MTKENKTNSIFKSLKPLGFYAKTYPADSVLVISLLLISGLAEAISVVTLFPILNLAIDGKIESSSKIGALVTGFFESISLNPTIGTLLTILVSLLTLKAILVFISMYKVGKTSARIAYELRQRLINGILNSDWQFFIKQKSGDLSVATTMEVERAAAVFIVGGRLAAGLIQVLAYLFIAYKASEAATISAVLVSGFLVIALKKLIEMARSAGANQTRVQKSLMSNLTEGLGSYKLIKTMGIEDLIKRKFLSDITQLFQVSLKKIISKEGLKNIQEPVYFLFMAIGIHYMLANKWFDTVESMLIIVLLFYRSVQRMGELQKNFQSLVQASPAFDFVNEVISRCEEAESDYTATKSVSFQEQIEFKNVSFSYGEHEILKKTNSKIPFGKFLSFYGGSGTGKTTSVDLITGLLLPSEGAIEVDGVDLKEIDQKKWKKLIGYVPQDCFLLHDSILNNVTFGDTSYTEKDVVSALEKAEAMGFINNLPNGIHTEVGERGAKLSGGQKQRVSIARALIRKPSLVIMDESTTALDPRTEREIIETLIKLKGSTTILAISHQSAIREASEIVFKLENKEIKELD